MESMVTQMNSFKWTDERKKLVFEDLKSHQPFQEAVPETTAEQQ